MTAAQIGGVLVIGKAGQLLIVAALEAWAYRRFRHHSFLLLLAGTTLALACWVLLSLPRLTGSPVSIARYQTGTAIYLAHIAFGLWGLVSLLVALPRRWNAVNDRTAAV